MSPTTLFSLPHPSLLSQRLKIGDNGFYPLSSLSFCSEIRNFLKGFKRILSEKFSKVNVKKTEFVFKIGVNDKSVNLQTNMNDGLYEKTRKIFVTHHI